MAKVPCSSNKSLVDEEIAVKQELKEEEIQIKQERPNETYEDHYSSGAFIDPNALKHEMLDREISEYEFRIKAELENIRRGYQNYTCVKEEPQYDFDAEEVKNEEFEVKEEVVGEYQCSVVLIEYQCLICDANCINKQLLLSHILDHGKSAYCRVCQKNYTQKTKTQHKCIRYEDRPHQCTVCHRRYTNYNNLHRHQKSHQPDAHQCHLCPRKFLYPSHLAGHIKRHFGTEKRFLCDMCHKLYHQLSHLERHQLTHTGKKPYRCEICQKRFADNTNLTNHRRSHADQRTYECSVCHRWFKTSSNLINHARIHTDVRPYVCNICEKTFRKKSNLTSHQRVHRIDQEIRESDVDTRNPPRRRGGAKRGKLDPNRR